MHSANCDNCNELFEDSHSGFTAFSDEGHLQECAESEGWHFTGKATVCYCPKCHKIDESDNLVIKKAPKSVSEQIAEDLRNGTFNK